MLGREELSCLSAPRVGLRDGRPAVVRELLCFLILILFAVPNGRSVQVARSSFAPIE